MFARRTARVAALGGIGLGLAVARAQDSKEEPRLPTATSISP
jgi:hypothetical protein